MARGNDGERSGDVRSPKRQRVPSLDEDEDEDDEDFEPANITEEEEEDEDDEDDEEEDEELGEEEEEEEDVTLSTMATIIGNDLEDLATEEEQMESPKSSQSVKLQSADILDCPTCCEPLTRPIYQCRNGHLACSSCCRKLNKTCSFCRSHIGDIRCRAMEKVIEASIVPCLNEKYGCKETTTYCDQSSHVKVCVFARCSCPVPNCNYVGSYTSLKSHASGAHYWDEAVMFGFDRPMIFSMDLDKKKTVVLKEEKEGDLIVVQAFKGSEATNGVYVTVNRIAPMAPCIREFSCSLAKLNQFSTLRVGSMVKKIQKVSEQMDPKGVEDVMWIPPRMLPSTYWKMQICIGYGYKYIHI